ncbi:cell division protein ZapA [Legionella israelensis]|uniref:Cell division protein ZapA n=1 Tax=Legionella israelensis TaxID=454 RepID=A0A0W0V2A4_9GAMM|nr:cell division protein ZapA [Legionella israelensis]KTD13990.1 Cell division protein ZapA [Legionella israelensis]QBR85254.1 cell division protein ZapA [Legionella israelensis]QBS09649.1 cell division protein ZapA [Legionella israelensis]SCY25679.1 cell division protein ZapA [Legionella israelensis DSM 19235]STX60580.1 Cell division protein ZapA [Legionella israelensis]
MSLKTCTIKLLSHSFEIKCPEGEQQNLQQAAQKLNELTMQQKIKFKHLDDFQALLLAALNISHELVCSQNEQEKQRLQVNQFINSLENKINKVMDTEAKI